MAGAQRRVPRDTGAAGLLQAAAHLLDVVSTEHEADALDATDQQHLRRGQDDRQGCGIEGPTKEGFSTPPLVKLSCRDRAVVPQRNVAKLRARLPDLVTAPTPAELRATSITQVNIGRAATAPRRPHRDHAVAGLEQLAPGQARPAGTVCQEGVLRQLVQATEAAAGRQGGASAAGEAAGAMGLEAASAAGRGACALRMRGLPRLPSRQRCSRRLLCCMLPLDDSGGAAPEAAGSQVEGGDELDEVGQQYGALLDVLRHHQVSHKPAVGSSTTRVGGSIACDSSSTTLLKALQV